MAFTTGSIYIWTLIQVVVCFFYLFTEIYSNYNNIIDMDIMCSSPCKWNKSSLKLWKYKKNLSKKKKYNIRRGKIYSLAHPEKKKRNKEPGELSNTKNTWMSTEDESGGWTQNRFHGEEKPLHNSQPREQHSPGGRLVSQANMKRSPQESTKGSLQGASHS